MPPGEDRKALNINRTVWANTHTIMDRLGDEDDYDAYSTASSNREDDGGPGQPPVLYHVEKSKTVQLGLSNTYAPDWTLEDARREPVQNW